MATAEQVDHGYLLHKIVRVYPQWINCGLWRLRHDAFHHPAETPYTDELIVKHVVDLCKGHGYVSGDIAKVVMVSRFGDVGLTKKLNTEFGYDLRIDPSCLEIVSETTETS